MHVLPLAVLGVVLAEHAVLRARDVRGSARTRAFAVAAFAVALAAGVNVIMRLTELAL